MDLSIIIVNWNVKDLLRNCLQSLLNAGQSTPDLTTEIIVIDSSSTDGSPQMVRDEFPQVRLIASDQNLGYASGNNTGAADAYGFDIWFGVDVFSTVFALKGLWLSAQGCRT